MILQEYTPELRSSCITQQITDAHAPSTSETNQVWHNRNCRILYTTVSKCIYIYIRARNAELSMLKEFKHAWHVYFIIHVCPLTITNDTSYMVSRSRIGQIDGEKERKREEGGRRPIRHFTREWNSSSLLLLLVSSSSSSSYSRLLVTIRVN